MMKRGERDLRTARRYVSAFLRFLNCVGERHRDPADAFISGVADCRKVIDRYLVAMSVRVTDMGDGSKWLRPPVHSHRKVADALVAIGKVTATLTHVVFDGQDPSKVDGDMSRTGGKRLPSVKRTGAIRIDTDRRLRIGSDPTVAPRLDDPRVHERWAAGLRKTGASPVFDRILDMLRHAGMRCFQPLGMTLHDAFCLGAIQSLPVPNKGDADRQRTLRKKLPPKQYDALLEYVRDERARVSGLSLRDIRLIARDPFRWSEIENLPLFTEDGVSHITYDRLRSVCRTAAVAMDLVLNDVDPDGPTSTQRAKYVVLHMLRHEYVHERLAEIARMHETKQAPARRALISYMGWRGEGMLEWYSAHYRVAAAAVATAENNARWDALLAGRTAMVASTEFDDALSEFV